MVFTPAGPDDDALMEQFKRDTVQAVMGDAALFDVWFPAERSYASYLERCRALDPASCVLVNVDGAVAGALHLNVHDNGNGHLNNIYLKPEWRGKGVGERMMAYAEAFFKKHGCRRAYLKTHPDATKVVAFYKRMGWQFESITPQGMVEMSGKIAL